uniref:C-C motif chemokine 3-like n=1 Tax=Euleptes europaea TaxID=460621 RepID=UPI00254223CF|nr:C-C motif chemokine 3-like [Euleptes europaea]
MKAYASLCTLALLFLLAVCSRNSSTQDQLRSITIGVDERPVSAQNECCFRFVSKRIPLWVLADYYKTSSRCSLPAIVFITRRGKHICANPTDQWVQHHVSRLELSGAGMEPFPVNHTIS